MTDTPDGSTPDGSTPGSGTGRRPRPSPRPRAGGARPSPRPRVAGSRRAEEDAAAAEAPTRDAPTTRTSPPPSPTPTPSPSPRARSRGTEGGSTGRVRGGATALADRARPSADGAAPAGGRGRRRGAGEPRTGRGRDGAAPDRRRPRTLALVLAVLCVLTAAGGGWLLWERLHPTTVDPAIFTAAREGVQAVYAYDYQDSEGSVQRKLDVLTGDLRDQYETDLSSGGIISTYEQVSATTSYDVLEVGLQQVNQSQDQATLVVFGQYVVSSVNSGTQAAPAGSECTVTSDGAQSCTQTVRVTVTDTDDGWKISELTLLTSS
ncbi:hypothetical protein TEK04_00050 [Klenkia sp. LSe6-5]|uniref:Mce-associated membrane protein n=1 Tax=Klenkia sesuvii TaxID=3103137 RepID=A0ABU8DNX2_9ACTN